jgi:hypothetical protein
MLRAAAGQRCGGAGHLAAAAARVRADVLDEVSASEEEAEVDGRRRKRPARLQKAGGSAGSRAGRLNLHGRAEMQSS